jgi:pimeloyl-ACP methyl ester carboxylesterase
MTPERVLQLRRDQGLLGILTPAPPAKAADFACILMNAGVVHRIGPHRLNVKVARHLAEQGITTIRLDLSGIGDSRPEGSARSFSDQAVADIRAAMDQLQRMNGTRRFVVSGLCSGAAVGFRAALADPRVVGLQMLDPYAYRTRAAMLRYYAGRMRLPEAWSEAVANLVRSQPSDEATNGLLGDFVKDPPPEEFARGLATLIERGVSVMCVYTGAVLQVYNYPEQFDEIMEPFGIAGRIRVEHMPDSTHTFLDVASQQRLLEITDRWLRSLRGPARERA